MCTSSPKNQRGSRFKPHFIKRLSSWLVLSTSLTIVLGKGLNVDGQAASGNWLGSVDATWAGPNWSASPPPGTGDTATFNGAGNGFTTIDLGAGVTVNTMLFDTAGVAAYTIGAGPVNSQTLTLNNGGAVTMNPTVGANQLFNAAVVLGTDATAQSYAFTNNSTTNSLTFAGNISGGATGTAGTKTLTVGGAGAVSMSGNISNGGATGIALTKTGVGTLTLSGTNSFNGITTISGGTVRLGSATALGNAGTGGTDYTSVGAGATLDLNGQTIAESFGRGGSTLPADGFAGATAILTNSSATAASITGVINFDGGGAMTVNGSGDISLTRVSRTNGTTGTVTITKDGAGTLTLDGTVDNSAVAMTLNAGVVVLAKTSSSTVHALGAGSTVSGGTLRLAGTGGDQILDTAAVTVNGTGVFDLNGRNEVIDGLTLSGGGLVTNSASATTGVLTVGSNGGTVTVSGIIQNGAGTTAVTKAGTGTMTVSNNQTYTGDTTVTLGTLILDFAAAGGTNDNLLSAGTAVRMNNNSTFRTATLTLTGDSVTNNQAFTGLSFLTTNRHRVVLTSGAGGAVNLNVGALSFTTGSFVDFVLPASGAITTSNADAVLSPTITLNNGSSYAQILGGTLTAFSGDLVYVTATNISTMAGYAATSNLTVDSTSTGNVIQAAGTTDLNTVSVTDTTGRTLTIGSGSTLRLGAIGGILRSATAGSVVVGDPGNAGELTTGTLAGADLVLTNGNATGTLTINSVIRNNDGGAVDVVVNGASASGATTILAGANTYTGTTLVQVGALRVANNTGLGSVSGATTIQDGAAVELFGSITVGDEALSIIGTGTGSNGALRNVSGTNTYGGLVTLVATAEIQADTGSTLIFDRPGSATAVTTASAITFDAVGTGVITFNDALVTTGSSNPTIAKGGTGTLNLNTANTFGGSGGFTLNDGVVRISHGGALGGTGGSTTVTDNAALELVGSIATDEAITILNSTGVSAGGAIRNISGNNFLTGQVTVDDGNGRIHSDAGILNLASTTALRGDPTSGSNRTVTLGGAGMINIIGNVLNGAGTTAGVLTVSKDGAGTLYLRGINAYTGVTTVSGGTLVVTSASGLGTGNVVVATNTAFNYFAAVDAPLSIGGTLAIAGGANTVIGASIGSTATSARINVTGAATISNAAHRVNIYGVLGTAPATGTYTLIAGGAGSNLAPATAPTLGTVFNNTNFTVGSFSRTAATLSVDITSAAALTSAFWTGGLTGGANVWSASNGTTASNWVTTVGGGTTALVPGVGADVIISATSVTTAPIGTVLGANMAIKTLTISDTTNGLGLEADGSTLTIAPSSAGTGITVDGGVPASTIAANLALGAAQTWTNNSINDLTVSGIVSGAFALIKAGPGTLNLSGVNTYSGGTTLSAGNLTANSSQALGLAANALTINGGTLNLASDVSTTAKNTTVASNTTIIANRTTAGLGITHTLGTLSIGAFELDVTAGANVISGTAGVAFGATTLTGASIFDVGGAANLTLAGVATAGFNVTKQGAGTMTITGTGSGTGVLTVNAGTATINGSGSWLGNVNVASGGTIQNTGAGTNSLGAGLIVQSGGVYDNQQAGSETVASFTLGGTGIGGTGAWVNNSLTSAGALTSTAGIVLSEDTSVGGSGNLTTTSIISGASFGLTKIGNGTLTLGGVNTYGSLTIKAGAVIGTTSTSAFGAGTITLGDTAANAAAVSLTGLISTANITNAIVLAPGTTGAITIATSNNASTFTYSGGVTGSNNVRVATNANQTLTFSTNVFNNAGSITNVGAGVGGVFITADIGSNVTDLTQSSATSVLTLSGANIAFDGALTVSAGTLNITGGATTAPTPNALTVAGGGTLNLINTVGQEIALGSKVITLGGTGTTILGLELGSLAAYDRITSTVAANTSGAVQFNLTGLSGLTAGSYDLLTASSGLDLATYSIGTLSNAGGLTYSVSSDPTFVRLTATALTGPLYWKGALNNSWSAYTGGNTNFTTDLAGSINAGGTPGAANSVIFVADGQTGTSLSTTLDGILSIRDLTFNANVGAGPLGTINIAPGTGGTLTLTPILASEGINVETSAPANINISAPVILGSAQTWTVMDAATVLAVTSGISGTGNLTKAGSGILSLSGTNNYVGTTTVSGGILRAGTANTFNASSAYIIGATGTLRLNGLANTIASLSGATGGIVENGAASGNVTLIAGDGSSTSFAGTIQNGGAATLGFTKLGSGKLTLSGTNTYTGTTTVTNGILEILGSTTTGAASVVVGGIAGARGILSIGTGGALSTTSLFTGSNATAAGAVYQTDGSVTSTATDGTNAGIVLGNAAGGYGYYKLSGGTLTANRLTVGGSGFANATGVFEQTGGTATNNVWTLPGQSGTTSSLTDISGGQFNAAGSLAMNHGSNSYSVLNVRVGGTLHRTSTAGISLLQGNTSSLNNVGILNLLDGGTINTNAGGIINGNGTSSAGNLLLANFNGGTIFTNTASSTLVNITGAALTAASGAYLYSGGLTVNTNNLNSTLPGILRAPTDEGVATLAVASGGSGYIGAPMIKISGGSGVGATAVANMVDDGTGNGTYMIGSITVTNPGTGYLNTDVLTLAFADNARVYTAQATFGALAFNGGNISGGLTKTGAGTLTLSSAASTFTGPVRITAGAISVTALTNIGSAGALGAGLATTIATNAASLVLNGGTLSYAGAAAAGATDRLLTVTENGGQIDSTSSTAANSINFSNTNAVAYSGAGARTLTFGGANTGSNTFAPVISNAGSDAVTVAKTGAGTWALTNASTAYTGGTNIGGGVLIFSSGALGLAGNITFTGNSTLRWNTGATDDLSSRLVLTNAVTGTVDTNGNNVTFANTVGTTGGTAGVLRKVGAGALTLNAAADHTGGTELNAGTLNIGHAGALGSGLFTISGASTFDHTTGSAATLTGDPAQAWNADFTFTGTNSLNMGAGAVNLSANRTVTVSANTLTVGGIIGDTGGDFGLTKLGAGTLHLTGANAFGSNDAINISGGVLKIDAESGLGDTTNDVVFSNGATLHVSSGFSTSANKTFSFTAAGGGTIQVESGTMSINTALIGSSGTGGLIKTGAGTLALSVASTAYDPTGVGVNGATGVGFRVDAGTLLLASNSNSVVGDNNPTTMAIQLNGGNLTVQSDTASIARANLYVSAVGTLTIDNLNVGPGITQAIGASTGPQLTMGTGSSTLNIVGGANVTSGTAVAQFANATFLAAPTFNLTNLAGATMQLNLGAVTAGANTATFTGNGSFVQSGVWGSTGGGITLGATYSGLATLNQVNTYTGVTTVNGGALAFSTAANLGDGSATNDVSLGGGTLRYTAAGALNLDVDRQVTLSTGTTSTVEVTNSTGNLQVTGGFITSGVTNLVKTGVGRVSATGALNLNGGNITVSEGTYAGGLAAASIGSISVAGNGSLQLVDAAAVSITLAGGLTLNGGARLGFELGAPATNDSLSLAGAATLTAGTITLDFYNIGGLAAGSYTLVSAGSGLLPGGVSYVLGSAPAGFNYVINQSDTSILLTTSVLSNRYWTGSQATTSWSTINPGPLSNFSTDLSGLTNSTQVPQNGDTVIFSASTVATSPVNTTLDAAFTIDSLVFNANPAGGTFSIAAGTGGSLNLSPVSTTNGITVANNGGAVSISAPLTVGTTQTWLVDGTGTSSLSLTGNTTFTAGVTKTGNGVLAVSGTNSGAGGFTLAAGTLTIGSSSALGTGTFTIEAATTFAALAGLTLTSTQHVWNGSFTFGGTQSLDLGPGAVTLGGSLTATVISGRVLTVGGGVDDGASTFGITKADNGTLVFNGNNGYDGLTLLSVGTLTLAGDNSGASGGVATTGGTLNINSATALGPGTFTIGGGTINNSTGAGITLTTNNVQNWNASFTFTGTQSLNLGTGDVTLNATPTVTVNASTLTVGGGISGGFGLIKAGPGTLTLTGLSATAADNYVGTTTLDNGTTNVASAAAFTGGLTFGSSTANTTPATLNLPNGATFAGAVLVQNSTATANIITVDSGQTLTLNGNVTIGAATPAAANATARLSIGGGGHLNVLTATGGSFQVGGTTAAISQASTLDLTGLASATINVSATGTVRVNQPTTSNVAGNQSSLLLPTPTTGILPTTPVTTITAANFNVGDNGSYGGAGNQVNTVTLGTGLTTLNVNTVNVGTGGRDFGRISFATGNGTIKLRAADGASRAAFNVGTGSATTGVGTQPTVNNNVDLRGHSADLQISTLAIGGQNRLTNRTDTFAYDTGVLDVTTVVLATNTGTPSTAAGTFTPNWTSNLNIGGGTTTIGTGGVDMAFGQTAAISGAQEGTKTLVGNFNISGGTVTIANNATFGAAIRMSQSIQTSVIANSTLNITGGTVTLAGHIIKGSNVGAGTATVTLNGGTLDMTGKNIGGTAPATVIFNAQSGTLKNLAQLNAGFGALNKTTSGTLHVDGTNTYTTATTVSEGALSVLVSGSISGSTVSVANAGTFNVNGTITTPATLAVDGRLSGSGTINGAGGLTSVSATGTVSPGSTLNGEAGYGTLTANAFSSATGATLKLELGASTVGNYDQLVTTDASSTTTLNAGGGPGTTLNVDASAFTFTAPYVDKFFVIINGGTNLVAGTFANTTTVQNVEGTNYDTLTFNGVDFAISYLGDAGTGTFEGGNDVVLMAVAVPEPNSLAMLAGSLGLALGLQRFRRQSRRTVA
jgi:autotransporter-associated beta strand protein